MCSSTIANMRVLSAQEQIGELRFQAGLQARNLSVQEKEDIQRRRAASDTRLRAMRMNEAQQKGASGELQAKLMRRKREIAEQEQAASMNITQPLELSCKVLEAFRKRGASISVCLPDSNGIEDDGNSRTTMPVGSVANCEMASRSHRADQAGLHRLSKRSHGLPRKITPRFEELGLSSGRVSVKSGSSDARKQVRGIVEKFEKMAAQTLPR